MLNVVVLPQRYVHITELAGTIYVSSENRRTMRAELRSHPHEG